MLVERLGWTSRGLDSLLDGETRAIWARWRESPEAPSLRAWRDLVRRSDQRRSWLPGHLLLLWGAARWPGRLPAERVLYHARSAVMLAPQSRGVKLLAGDAVSLCGLQSNRMDWWHEGVRLMRQGMGWGGITSPSLPASAGQTAPAPSPASAQRLRRPLRKAAE